MFAGMQDTVLKFEFNAQNFENCRLRILGLRLQFQETYMWWIQSKIKWHVKYKIIKFRMLFLGMNRFSQKIAGKLLPRQILSHKFTQFRVIILTLNKVFCIQPISSNIFACKNVKKDGKGASISIRLFNSKFTILQ